MHTKMDQLVQTVCELGSGPVHAICVVCGCVHILTPFFVSHLNNIDPSAKIELINSIL